jgi:hypothetical protein
MSSAHDCRGRGTHCGVQREAVELGGQRPRYDRLLSAAATGPHVMGARSMRGPALDRGRRERLQQVRLRRAGIVGRRVVLLQLAVLAQPPPHARGERAQQVRDVAIG